MEHLHRHTHTHTENKDIVQRVYAANAVLQLSVFSFLQSAQGPLVLTWRLCLAGTHTHTHTHTHKHTHRHTQTYIHEHEHIHEPTGWHIIMNMPSPLHPYAMLLFHFSLSVSIS